MPLSSQAEVLLAADFIETVIGRSEPDPLPVELALQHRELMAQRQDLHVLVPIAARQQPQQRERVRDAQVRQAQQQ